MEAIESVEATGRLPREAVLAGNATLCGRTERAHEGPGQPHRTRFPTAPTRVIDWQDKEEGTHGNLFTHEFPTLPSKREGPRCQRWATDHSGPPAD
jgi:hypothetical protein